MDQAVASLPMKKQKSIFKELYFYVLLSIVLGILAGHFFPEFAVSMKPLGDAFIKIIKMMIGPIVFCAIVSGVCSMDNMRSAGRVAGKTIKCFIAFTIISLALGLIVANVYAPGAGMNVDPSTLDTAAIQGYVNSGHALTSVHAFLMNIIPDSLVSAFTSGDTLQVLMVSILFSISLFLLGDKGKPIAQGIQQASHVLFKMIGMIMYLAPFGAFGAMAFTVGKFGISSLSGLFQLMASFYATCIVFIVVVLGLTAKYCGFSIFKLMRYLKEEIFIALGTGSSESILPRAIEKMSKMGCSRSIVGLVMPTGYSFNLTGTAISLTMSALFIAQATNTEITFAHQLYLLLLMLLTSKGAAAVPGAAFVVLASTLESTGYIPVAGMVLILGIDRFMTEARVITNLIGNSVTTLLVAKWENGLDYQQAHAVLNGNGEGPSSPTPLGSGITSPSTTTPPLPSRSKSSFAAANPVVKKAVELR